MKAIGFDCVNNDLISSPKKSHLDKIAMCIGAVALAAAGSYWLATTNANSENIQQIKAEQTLIRTDMHEWAKNSNRVADGVETLVDVSIKSNNEMKAMLSESNTQTHKNQVEVISKIDELSTTTNEVASNLGVLVEETVKTNAEVSKMVSMIEAKDKAIEELTSKLETTQAKTNNLHVQLTNARVEVEKVKADNQGFFSKLF